MIFCCKVIKVLLFKLVIWWNFDVNVWINLMVFLGVILIYFLIVVRVLRIKWGCSCFFISLSCRCWVVSVDWVSVCCFLVWVWFSMSSNKSVKLLNEIKKYWFINENWFMRMGEINIIIFMVINYVYFFCL